MSPSSYVVKRIMGATQVNNNTCLAFLSDTYKSKHALNCPRRERASPSRTIVAPASKAKAKQPICSDAPILWFAGLYTQLVTQPKHVEVPQSLLYSVQAWHGASRPACLQAVKERASQDTACVPKHKISIVVGAACVSAHAQTQR